MPRFRNNGSGANIIFPIKQLSDLSLCVFVNSVRHEFFREIFLRPKILKGLLRRVEIKQIRTGIADVYIYFLFIREQYREYAVIQRSFFACNPRLFFYSSTTGADYLYAGILFFCMQKYMFYSLSACVRKYRRIAFRVRSACFIK